MTQATTLHKIKGIISEVNSQRTALEDYKQKLNATKAELEQARADRQKSFSFETDKKVVELEGFVSRLDRRYTEENQAFDNTVTEKLNEVEQLFYDHVVETWRGDKGAQALEAQTVESFMQTAQLLARYADTPAIINKQAMAEVMTDDFRQAFSGKMTFIGADKPLLATAIPLGADGYQAIYNAAKALGVVFE